MAALDTYQKDRLIESFESIQKLLIQAFEKLDPEGEVTYKSWDRPEGGGRMGVMRARYREGWGNVLQCTVSPLVRNPNLPETILGIGVSTITHMMNPHAPIGHMNVRAIEVGDSLGRRC